MYLLSFPFVVLTVQRVIENVDQFGFGLPKL
jgi:hypothetical protein